ncbi:hypothetical protein QBC34DRAFT_417567 [Podospora aff. communis PSN243]|uniref:Uncharacterized protein n=1 Tax=Podospora aff. communis PSN243 TaxID=3040156 RepID=A0AAV9G4T0_9PEZI|nr:hypothetical protein QBC34DRAFT_417567 [Podospora aff. communis PSN243]
MSTSENSSFTRPKTEQEKEELSKRLQNMSKADLLKFAETLPKPTKNVYGVSFGWPESGGVWVLRNSEALSRKDLPVVKTMEEHCALLESLGATFHRNPDDCEEVRRTRSVMPTSRAEEQHDRTEAGPSEAV